MKFDVKAMGLRIRTERLKNKLTIEKLCEILEVSPSFIGLVERGISGISLEKLCKLSEIFQVSTDYLLKGEEVQQMNKRTNIQILNSHLYSYTDEELVFVLDVLNFLHSRVSIK